jgi:hypothetical protein
MSGWLDADAIIARVDDLVLKLGDDAFAHDGRAHLYSGPSPEVSGKIAGYDAANSNHERAKRRAAKAKAVLIDDTKIGRFLAGFEGVGVYGYFNQQRHLTKREQDQASAKVWRHASRLFVLSLWGEITTTVCGARRSGAYYVAEIPALSAPAQISVTIPETMRALFVKRSKAIDTVNEMPMAKISKLYAPEDYEPAHRLICLAEQRLDLRAARRDRDLQARLDFYTSREQYRVDRYEALNDRRPVYAHQPDERYEARQTAIRGFVADLLRDSRVSLEGLAAPMAPAQQTASPGLARLAS